MYIHLIHPFILYIQFILYLLFFQYVPFILNNLHILFFLLYTSIHHIHPIPLIHIHILIILFILYIHYILFILYIFDDLYIPSIIYILFSSYLFFYPMYILFIIHLFHPIHLDFNGRRKFCLNFDNIFKQILYLWGQTQVRVLSGLPSACVTRGYYCILQLTSEIEVFAVTVYLKTASYVLLLVSAPRLIIGAVYKQLGEAMKVRPLFLFL